MSNTPSSNLPPAVPPLPTQPDLSVPQNAGTPSPVIQAGAQAALPSAPNSPESVMPVGANGQAGLPSSITNATAPVPPPQTSPSGITTNYKPSFGRKMLDAMFSALRGVGQGVERVAGGMAPQGQEQYGPHGEDLGTYKYSPGRRAGMGALRLVSAMSQGLGQHGPGSLGRSVAAGAKGGQGILDEDQRMSAELYRQHALTFASYQANRQQDTPASQQISDRNAPWTGMLDNAVKDGIIKGVNNGALMPWSQAFKEIQALQAKGYMIQNIGVAQVGTQAAPKTTDNPTGQGTVPVFKVYYSDDPKGIAQHPVTFTDETAALAEAQNAAQIPMLGVIKNINSNQATALVGSTFRQLFSDAHMDVKQGEIPPNGSNDALLLGTAAQHWTKYLQASKGNFEQAVNTMSFAEGRGGELFIDTFLGGDPANAKKYDNWAASEKTKAEAKARAEGEAEGKPKEDILVKYEDDPGMYSGEKSAAAIPVLNNMQNNETDPSRKIRIAKVLTVARQAHDAYLMDLQNKARAEQSVRDGNPADSGKMLAEGTLTLTDLKTRGVSPEYLTQAISAAQKFDPAFLAPVAIGQEKIAGSQSNQQFFGNATSLVSQGGTLDQLQAIGNKISQSDWQVLNKATNWAELQAGKGPIAAYAAAILGPADDYAKVMGGGIGTDTARRQIIEALSPALAPEQRQQAISAMKNAVTSQAQGRIGTNRYLRAMYGPLFNAPGSPSGAHPGEVVVRDKTGNILGYSSDGKTITRALGQ